LKYALTYVTLTLFGAFRLRINKWNF